MGRDTRRRHLDWKDEAQSEYERARAAERERGIRLLEHFAMPGPENEGLMALTLRTMQFRGLLDGAKWTQLYRRWRESWFWDWLCKNAGRFGFKPIRTEKWHCVYKP